LVKSLTHDNGEAMNGPTVLGSIHCVIYRFLRYIVPGKVNMHLDEKVIVNTHPEKVNLCSALI
jgi:hypothetical protein